MKAESDPRETNTAQVPKQMENTFPQPRLETSEPTEIRDFRLKEEQQLHSYGWVDQQAGCGPYSNRSGNAVNRRTRIVHHAKDRSGAIFDCEHHQ